MHNSDFIYTHKKIATIPVPVFTNITNAEQRYV